jgi:putative spermidine/putrescine transport system substrate-binding protein
VLVAACGSSSSGGTGPSAGSGSGGTSGLKIPTVNDSVPSSVGQGEGKLNLIAWEGYAQPQWVKPFEQATGCQVNAKYAGSSNEMVSLMAHGGGGQYDLVSASGDADLRLIYGGDVRPINIGLIPQWKNFHPFLQNPAFNTIDGKHFGTSYEFGPNVLLYNTKTFPTAPSSWSVLYNKKYSGKITVPDNPIQIADAALYLSKTQPSLGITDPYELTQTQFNAVVTLLKAQHSEVGNYWSDYTKEQADFDSGNDLLGTTWEVITQAVQADNKVSVNAIVPSEGSTGWSDTWMISSKSAHPDCAYEWMNWIVSPKVNAEVATYFGEAPANSLACTYADAITPGFCEAFHADDPSYWKDIYYWSTPTTECGDGTNDCVPYADWVTAWNQIKA